MVGVGGGGVNGLADWGAGRKDGRRAGREMREVGVMQPFSFRPRRDRAEWTVHHAAGWPTTGAVLECADMSALFRPRHVAAVKAASCRRTPKRAGSRSVGDRAYRGGIRAGAGGTMPRSLDKLGMTAREPKTA